MEIILNRSKLEESLCNGRHAKPESRCRRIWNQEFIRPTTSDIWFSNNTTQNFPFFWSRMKTRTSDITVSKFSPIAPDVDRTGSSTNLISGNGKYRKKGGKLEEIRQFIVISFNLYVWIFTYVARESRHLHRKIDSLMAHINHVNGNSTGKSSTSRELCSEELNTESGIIEGNLSMNMRSLARFSLVTVAMSTMSLLSVYIPRDHPSSPSSNYLCKKDTTVTLCACGSCHREGLRECLGVWVDIFIWKVISLKIRISKQRKTWWL